MLVQPSAVIGDVAEKFGEELATLRITKERY
jgi:hypothetical protein